ncbi:cystatin-F [Sorex araneus]|uniref:cystatin-F n=1 Tax=Sorex araneus TaxID=42254 RepID=UPI002433C39B|nr:cystatin-F [Sorex araneus]
MLRSCELLACCLALGTLGCPSPDFCQQIFDSGVKPGFPMVIKTNDPKVLQAARLSVERFNNCTNDVFLFKESHIESALVQVVKGLKYMLGMLIGRTTCKKTQRPHLDSCNFQTNHTLVQTLSCYSEIWTIPWLHKSQVTVLHCHQLPPGAPTTP